MTPFLLRGPGLTSAGAYLSINSRENIKRPFFRKNISGFNISGKCSKKFQKSPTLCLAWESWILPFSIFDGNIINRISRIR